LLFSFKKYFSSNPNERFRLLWKINFYLEIHLLTSKFTYSPATSPTHLEIPPRLKCFENFCVFDPAFSRTVLSSIAKHVGSKRIENLFKNDILKDLFSKFTKSTLKFTNFTQVNFEGFYGNYFSRKVGITIFSEAVIAAYVLIFACDSTSTASK